MINVIITRYHLISGCFSIFSKPTSLNLLNTYYRYLNRNIESKFQAIIDKFSNGKKIEIIT